jgi:hypothetical protein
LPFVENATAFATTQTPQNSCPLFFKIYSFESFKNYKNCLRYTIFTFVYINTMKKEEEVLTPHDVGCSDT